MRLSAAATTAFLLAGTALSGTAYAQAPDPRAVLETYADIAHAMYEDSLAEAREMLAAIEALVADPSPEMLEAARTAWREARVPYQQTEGLRFGNAWVDAWEGRVNAWPLDEGLIDYVEPAAYGTESDENAFYTVNVIANQTLMAGGREIDATNITKQLLQDTLHEIDEIEANVATGYHAIEFLLWGQDLNGTGPGAGNRPYTDFDVDACTGGNCERRVAYLTTATDLLLDDLSEAVAAWDAGGEARAALMDGTPEEGLATIVTGLGSLSYGELAGERMQLGLLLNDPEEEHDCFADNTHWSHYYNQVGMIALYTGSYTRPDGSVVEGPSLAELVRADNPELDATLQRAMGTTLGAMDGMVAAAENGMAYDMMLAADNPLGNAILQNVIDRLKDQTRVIEQVATALDLGGVSFEGSDSLDNPAAVFQ